MGLTSAQREKIRMELDSLYLNLINLIRGSDPKGDKPAMTQKAGLVAQLAILSHKNPKIHTLNYCIQTTRSSFASCPDIVKESAVNLVTKIMSYNNDEEKQAVVANYVRNNNIAKTYELVKDLDDEQSEYDPKTLVFKVSSIYGILTMLEFKDTALSDLIVLYNREHLPWKRHLICKDTPPILPNEIWLLVFFYVGEGTIKVNSNKTKNENQKTFDQIEAELKLPQSTSNISERITVIPERFQDLVNLGRLSYPKIEPLSQNHTIRNADTANYDGGDLLLLFDL